MVDDLEVQRVEIQRLRAWLEALADIRRIVGFVDDGLVEVLAKRALNGEALPPGLRQRQRGAA